VKCRVNDSLLYLMVNAVTVFYFCRLFNTVCHKFHSHSSNPMTGLGGDKVGDASPKQVLHELYKNYSHDVYRYARLSLGNHTDAMDVVQEVFLRAYKALTGYRQQAAPRTWLMAIARNYIFDLFRRRKTEHNYLREAVVETFIHRDPSESIESLMVIESLLLKLKDSYRQVFVLRHIEEFSVAETAQILGWTPAKVRTVHHRAVNRLRALAKSELEEVKQQ
jgi:RNA polymerase sigma-70 factor (ECF subfamily)